VSDDDLQRGAVERMKGIDTILLGRRTYELFTLSGLAVADGLAAAFDLSLPN
jgi:hypothetical protein